MNRREKLERKVERREGWAQSAEARSGAASSAAFAMVLPLQGEPIKVGHHSESRHRNLLERADNAMRKAVGQADLATYHREKAEGLAAQLETVIFSDDDNAIAALEARIAEKEASKAEIKARAHASWELSNLNASIRTDKKRIEQIQAQSRLQQRAKDAGGVLVTPRGEWCFVRFAEKPAREVLDDLREAEFTWSRGAWYGRLAALPVSVPR